MINKDNLKEKIGKEFIDYLASHNYVTISANRIEPHSISGYEKIIGKYFDTFLTYAFRAGGLHEPMKFKKSNPKHQLVPYETNRKGDLGSNELKDGYGIFNNTHALAERDGYSAVTDVLEQSYSQYMDYLKKRDNRLSNVKILARKLKRNLESKL